MKMCNRCHETKPLDDFHRKDGGRLGRQSRCKKCINTLHHERYGLRQVASITNLRARRQGVVGKISEDDLRHLPKDCVFCGTGAHIEVDHATPFSRGGENTWANLTSACHRCNVLKGHLTVPEFLCLLTRPAYRKYVFEGSPNPRHPRAA